MWRVRKVAFPPESRLRADLPAAYFHDAWETALSDPSLTPAEIAERALGATPRWVEAMLRLRNGLVKPFGVRAVGALGKRGARPAGGWGHGDRLSIFRIVSIDDGELVMGIDDVHLDVRISFLGEDPQLGGPSLHVAGGAVPRLYHHRHDAQGQGLSASVPEHRRFAAVTRGQLADRFAGRQTGAREQRAVVGRDIQPRDPELLRRLLRAKDRMDAASGEAWPVSRLARVSGVSEAHFARSFRDAFGVPPHRYLLTRRIERAKTLLRDTDLPILEIAFETGWNSLGTFGRVFRDITGESPGELRTRDRAAPHARDRVPACYLSAAHRPDLKMAVSEKRRQAADAKNAADK